MLANDNDLYSTLHHDKLTNVDAFANLSNKPLDSGAKMKIIRISLNQMALGVQMIQIPTIIMRTSFEWCMF